MKSIQHYARKLCRRLGYDVKKSSRLILPTISIEAFCDRNVTVNVQELAAKDGNVSVLELLSINALVATRAPKHLFEIGTFDGRTTLNMIANSPDGAVIYTLDLPKNDLGKTAFSLDPRDEKYVDKEVSGARFLRTKWADSVVQLFGDSAKFDFTPYHGRMDAIFIDGSHHFDYVKSDTEAALKLVSPNGLIMWHDYQPDWPGVIEYLEQLYGRGGKFLNLRNISNTSLVYLRNQ